MLKWKFGTTAFIFALSSGLLTAQEGAWKLDKAHSGIRFDVTHMALSEVSGTFDEYDIIFSSSSEDFSDASIQAVITTTSINTGNDRRDNHLRSSDFFAADSFPTITFTSMDIERREGNKYAITGELTIRGITDTVTFVAEHKGTIETGRGVIMGWTAHTTIDRYDFGLKWGRMIENVGLAVGREVRITLNVRLTKA